MLLSNHIHYFCIHCSDDMLRHVPKMRPAKMQSIHSMSTCMRICVCVWVCVFGEWNTDRVLHILTLSQSIFTVNTPSESAEWFKITIVLTIPSLFRRSQFSSISFLSFSLAHSLTHLFRTHASMLAASFRQLISLRFTKTITFWIENCIKLLQLKPSNLPILKFFPHSVINLKPTQSSIWYGPSRQH